MDQPSIKTKLSHLPLGDIRYFESVGSTNTLAAAWAERGAPDLSVVLADEQTEGRGRSGRKWFTPPGSALALSVLLRPGADEDDPQTTRLTALGALAVAGALGDRYGLDAAVKWPNDVLLDRKKTCGVLAEAQWLGAVLQAVILGIGINVASPAVPPDELLNYPASCVEAALGEPVDRLDLLAAVLENLVGLREKVFTVEFIDLWEARLAFKGEWVRVSGQTETFEGQVLGLDAHGRLRLKLRSGADKSLTAGEINVRPLG
ncbi:MAG: biotin--[acetyl-CoA-carboxylase] ligase [Anaerolineales bacterium]|nr:biotin--[acetyl-CoA-carboxylase] ligase [Anaerolineales bacterium]